MHWGGVNGVSGLALHDSAIFHLPLGDVARVILQSVQS